MASTGPVKSHALHNFALSPLKWKNNHPRSQSPMREVLGKRKGVIDVKNDDLRNGVVEKDDCDDQFVEKSEIRASLSGSSSRNSDSKSKLLIRIPAGGVKNGENRGRGEGEEGSIEEGRKGEEGLEGEDEREGRIWNLRPRKAVKKSVNVNGGGGGGLKIGGGGNGKSDVVQKGNVESGSRIKVGGGDVNGSKKKEKQVKFSVSLTRVEIEEDVFSFTGSKPSRRPKKRAKAVQKQLDNLFPGLWLASVTPDSYKVSENYMKG